MLVESLRDVIVNDAVAAPLLATCEFTSGSPEPAVFTTERIPEGCDRPAVWIGEAGGTHWGTRARMGMDARLQVRLLGHRDWQMRDLRSVATALWEAINRADIDAYTTPRGYEGVLCLADPPQSVVDDEGFPGFVIVVRVVALKR